VVRGFSPKPGAEAPGYGFFSEININIVFHFPKALKHRAMDSSPKKNINIVFWLPGAAEAEPVEAKHRAMDSLPKKHQKTFLPTNLIFCFKDARPKCLKTFNLLKALLLTYVRG
jgi:hypothetical protein